MIAIGSWCISTWYLPPEFDLHCSNRRHNYVVNIVVLLQFPILLHSLALFDGQQLVMVANSDAGLAV